MGSVFLNFRERYSAITNVFEFMLTIEIELLHVHYLFQWYEMVVLQCWRTKDHETLYHRYQEQFDIKILLRSLC